MLDETETATPVADLGTEGGVSYVDLLKQDIDELAKSTDTYISVKGYDGSGLAIHYFMPEGAKELTLIAERIRREFKDDFARSIAVATDTILHLAEGLYVKPKGVSDYVMLDPQETGFSVKFDPRLAEILGVPELENQPRALVRRLFNMNDLALLDHFERLQRWLTNTRADLEAEVWQLGK